MQRLEGFYWVNYEGEWQVAKWYEYLPNRLCWDLSDRTLQDSDFQEIDERRIEREPKIIDLGKTYMKEVPVTEQQKAEDKEWISLITKRDNF